MKKIDKFFIIICLLIQVNLFDVLDLTNTALSVVMTYSQKKLLLVVVIIYSIFSLFFYRRKQEYQEHFFTFFVWLFVITSSLVILFTALRMDQTVLSTFFIGYNSFIILLYFPLRRALSDRKSVEYFVQLVGIFAFCFAISKTIQSYILGHTGRSILFLNSTLDVSSARSMVKNYFGFVRLASATDFVFFAFLLMIVFVGLGYKIFTKKVNLLMLTVYVIYLFFVGQTRIYLMLLLLILGIVILIKLKDKISFGVISVLLFIIAIPVSLMIAYIVNLLFFKETSRLISLSIRQGAIKYYLDNILYNGWFGFGFARDDVYNNLIHNTYMTGDGQIISFNYDDVGIIGFLAQFGISGIINMIVYLSSLLIAFIRSSRKFANLLLLSFILGSWASVSLFDPQRSFYLPVLLAIMDFVSSSQEENILE